MLTVRADFDGTNCIVCPIGFYCDGGDAYVVADRSSCTAGRYCPSTGLTSSTRMDCGAVSVYCPTGSSLPIAVTYVTACACTTLVLAWRLMCPRPLSLVLQHWLVQHSIVRIHHQADGAVHVYRRVLLRQWRPAVVRRCDTVTGYSARACVLTPPSNAADVSKYCPAGSTLPTSVPYVLLETVCVCVCAVGEWFTSHHVCCVWISPVTLFAAPGTTARR